ncbi:MAG: hypothetical protein JRM80_07380 [Nitrososphaerota archaeon]|nr:hypothetical protein [Nitrososphaerota archaeon]MDG6990970.1 hypothetical protein [Nitrososphaerota archaeon]
MPALYKAVVQRYDPTPTVLQLFATFREMVNDCLRLVAQKPGVPTYEGVKSICYPRMIDYPIHNGYRVSAMFEATNLVKKYQTDSKRGARSRPQCRRPFLKVSIGVSLQGGALTVPEVGVIKLTPHSMQILSHRGVKVKSVTLTPTNCSVLYNYLVEPMLPSGAVGIDMNLDNLTTFDTDGVSRFYDLRELTAIHETYRRVKSHFRRDDFRIKRSVFRKYSSIERNKRSAILHEISTSVVN